MKIRQDVSNVRKDQRWVIVPITDAISRACGKRLKGGLDVVVKYSVVPLMRHGQEALWVELARLVPQLLIVLDTVQVDTEDGLGRFSRVSFFPFIYFKKERWKRRRKDGGRKDTLKRLTLPGIHRPLTFRPSGSITRGRLMGVG